MIRASRPSPKRQGFTLIEILVVLALAAIVTSITIGGFNSMRQGNKRVSCQTNLNQIYQASRLYAADEGDKFPFYTSDCAATPNSSGIGLWSLYTFPDATGDVPNPNAPIERYLRNAKVLHCPAHVTDRNLYLPASSFYNQDYLSYQACDGTVPTYSSTRTTNTADVDWKRQLLHFDNSNFVARTPTGDTVVTWCMHHRGERDMDNVLFYDGSVQYLPRVYNGKTGWQRDPKPPT